MVYARPPKGCRTVHDDGSPIVWLMRVPLYGQGDAGLIWFRTMRKQLTDGGAELHAVGRGPVLLLEAHLSAALSHGAASCARTERT